MLVWKRRAANLHRANRKKTQNAVRGKLFCPVFSAKPLSNGDLRMRGRRHFYHIIFLPSWFWLGIIKSPQFLDINLECPHLPHDFHQQWMLLLTVFPSFWTHFVFFGGVTFLQPISSWFPFGRSQSLTDFRLTSVKSAEHRWFHPMYRCNVM